MLGQLQLQPVLHHGEHEKHHMHEATGLRDLFFPVKLRIPFYPGLNLERSPCGTSGCLDQINFGSIIIHVVTSHKYQTILLLRSSSLTVLATRE
jgi:hypothetical protein